MDLVALWGHVPALLKACDWDNTHAQSKDMQKLRLVIKVSSHIVLTVLKTYTLTPRKDGGNAYTCGTRLFFDEVSVFGET